MRYLAKNDGDLRDLEVKIHFIVYFRYLKITCTVTSAPFTDILGLRGKDGFKAPAKIRARFSGVSSLKLILFPRRQLHHCPHIGGSRDNSFCTLDLIHPIPSLF
jgi:hypothetical protein